MNRCENCPCYWQDADEARPTCHYESSSLSPLVPAPCDQDDSQEWEELLELAEVLADEDIPYPDDITYAELLDQVIDRGASEYWATASLMRMMDEVEEHTGTWPDWDDIAPDWIRHRMEG